MLFRLSGFTWGRLQISLTCVRLSSVALVTVVGPQDHMINEQPCHYTSSLWIIAHFNLFNSSNFRCLFIQEIWERLISNRDFFHLNTMCCAVSAWKTRLVESAKAKNQPEIHLQSVYLFLFDLQVWSLVVDWLLRKGVIQNGIPARAEPYFAVDLLNLKYKVLFHISY